MTIFVARAPGRLDVMGGIADYSGATVLELPLECATWAVVQRHNAPRCEFTTHRQGGRQSVSLDLEVLGSPDSLRSWLVAHPLDRWVGYVAGVAQHLWQRPLGLVVEIHSTVPEGRGLASSAALEVAAGAAVAACCGIAIKAPELAAACQHVENHVVGAPCGIMDQMTSACGLEDRLLRLKCQPAIIEGHLEIPSGYRCYGVDSGISHAVSGADYGTVRTAAFMGYRMIAARAGFAAVADGSRVVIADPRWRGCLANLTEAELAELGRDLPETMSGDEFLRRFDGITDPVTSVRADRRYPVRRATEHPVREQRRILRFAELLANLGRRPDAAEELGQLMFDSHASYGACGLSSEGTDRLVSMVAEAGPERGVFGAKITGGGSGGTVAVFGAREAEVTVREIARRYRAETGVGGAVYAASGPGADSAGVLVIASDEQPRGAQ